MKRTRLLVQTIRLIVTIFSVMLVVSSKYLKKLPTTRQYVMAWNTVSCRHPKTTHFHTTTVNDVRRNTYKFQHENLHYYDNMLIRRHQLHTTTTATTTAASTNGGSENLIQLRPLPATPYDDGQRPYQITTPIYYVNDKPHIGHAYTSTGT
jgi:hypothetical protein